MGAVVLVAILIVAVMILLSKTMRTRGRERVEETQEAARDAVVRSLEDHRRKREGEREQ